MRTQYYKLKKHIHFVEIFIVGITLRAIFVRHKTSHRRRSRVNGGHVPQNLYWGDDNDVRTSRIQHIMYLTTRYAVYLYLLAQGIMYCIAFNTGSVWSSHLEWLPEYQNPQKSLCLTQRIPRPMELSTALTSQTHTSPCSIRYRYRYMHRLKFTMLKD